MELMRFDNAIRRFDEENARDPHKEAGQPRELLYAQRLSEWVRRLAPNASEELLLAARSQHICRWMIPRASFPMDRAGYLKWRNELKKFHANKAGEILREVGYPETVVLRVQEFNLKKNFPADPESRVLEDALCLVFLEHQYADLASRTAEEKVVNALQKTWRKMSLTGREAALRLPFSAREKALLDKALAGTSPPEA